MKTTCPTITDKVAVITGGSKGIGAEISRLFSHEGYAVAVCYRNSKARAEALVNELNDNGGNAIAVYADLSSQKGADELRKRVIGELGKISVLVNNAGSSEYGLLAQFSEEDVIRSVTDNLLSAIYTLKAFYDDFAFGKSGSVINISSVWGICGASAESVYSAAKAGVIGFTRAMAKELAPSGVRVNAVAPGAIDTDMLARFTDEEKRDIVSEIPTGRLGTPRDIANAVLFLASDKASYITGQTVNVSGGYLI